MKQCITILILFFVPVEIFSCSCRGIEDYYTFFRNNNTSFVGKIISIQNINKHNVFTIEVLDKLRSSYKDTVIIYDVTDFIGCELGFEKNRTYLIDPIIKNKRLEMNACSYFISKANKPIDFTTDTMLIKLFAKKTFSIDCQYFKVNLVNAKREGEYLEYAERNLKDSIKYIATKGQYLHGKKIGTWFFPDSSNIVTYNNEGNFFSSKEIVNDTLSIFEKDNKVKMVITTNNKVYKEIDVKKRKYYVYYSDGSLKEVANLDQKYRIIEAWIKYNLNGTIKEIVKLNKVFKPSAYDEFYYY